MRALDAKFETQRKYRIRSWGEKCNWSVAEDCFVFWLIEDEIEGGGEDDLLCIFEWGDVWIGDEGVLLEHEIIEGVHFLLEMGF